MEKEKMTEVERYTQDLIKTIFKDIEKIIIDHYLRGLPNEMMLNYINKYKERVIDNSHDFLEERRKDV